MVTAAPSSLVVIWRGGKGSIPGGIHDHVLRWGDGVR